MRLIRQRFLRPIRRHRRAERHRRAVPQGQKAPRAPRSATAQIVMTRKQPPRTTPATKDFKLDRRSPKTPPRERGRGHVEHPVGLEPLGHVVVARDGHEPAGDPARANPLGNRRRADPRDVAIDDAGELVEGHQPRLGAVELASASARARSQRNCSPPESTPYGLIQLGGELNPTAVNSPVISLIGRSPRQSMTARSSGQGRVAVEPIAEQLAGRSCSCRCPTDRRSGRSARRRPVRGTSTRNRSVARWAIGTSNIPATCCTRNESNTGHVTVTSRWGMGLL